MIKIKNISKKYETLEALKDVNLNVETGSIYGLVGSNGAGKTTLLKVISGIYKQDSGDILIDNQPIYENVNLKSKLLFIPDNLYFFAQFTIKDMAKFYKGIYENFNEERYIKLKEAFNIDLNKKISSLSKGMQRQVAFWLSLSCMPDILVLDEPLDGLDPVMRQKVKNLLIQDVANRNMTIIISSHNLRELEDICDHIGILHKGSIVIEKDLDDLKSDIHKIQIAFRENTSIESLNKLNILYKEERGSVSTFIVRGNKNAVLSELGSYNPLILDILPLTLEEIFIYEMGDIGYEIKNIIV